MKKMLFLGIDTSTADALAYAKTKGVYTIITDYLEKTSSPLKEEADECWQINVTDLDALEQRCIEKNISAIFAGSHELCLDCCKILCERLDLPFYASDKSWKASRDKAIYKNYCRKAGLDVPEQYWIGGYPTEDALEKICFPVAVKPNDSHAQKGFSVVDSREALLPAIEKALAFSDQKKIIVEDFIQGNMVTVTCCICDGKLSLIDVFIGLPSEDDWNGTYSFGIHESRYNMIILEKLIPLYEKLIQELGCRQGTCFFQSILRDQTFYQLEIGYRLDGVGSWKHIERLTGINQLKYMVDLALGEASDDSPADISSKPASEICTCVAFWGKPGRIISIQGKKELLNMPDVIVQWDRYQEGDVIPDTIDMTAIVLMVEVFGSSHYEIDEKIRKINHSIHYYDKEGKDLLVYRDDFVRKWKAL